ncbi:MAG: PIN domain-containing protein [Candidatus Omnitrophica bacterium]|nr:PIN domain-containing protein [Candidatus Omnitrophota bacterium]MCA9427734.1 PIN domain-containing protein [Candidatus Omnitrophota bacterium]MCB9766651.1 PIN domain-containing protein [Candidatus Omnitrophota bacterium]
MIHVIDTHPLVWFLEANPKLSESVRGTLSDPATQIVIPMIVLAEIVYLYDKKRIKTAADEVKELVGRCDNCTLYPLDEAVIERIPTGLDIHDGLIVATALVFQETLGEEVSVVTKDREITESNLVRVEW